MIKSLNKDKRCLLCNSKDVDFFLKGKKASGYRDFFHCNICDLIFVSEESFLSYDKEKERYLCHNNSFNDNGYKKHLNQLIKVLIPFLDKDDRGLDFGAGPYPVLSMMLEEKGYNIDKYDPFFLNDKSLLDKTYDFIISTEVVEHFYKPDFEFSRINLLLRRNGFFGLMTGMLESWDLFEKWFYHNDLTHVVFYSKKTMRWISKKYCWDILYLSNKAVVFKKNL